MVGEGFDQDLTAGPNRVAMLFELSPGRIIASHAHLSSAESSPPPVGLTVLKIVRLVAYSAGVFRRSHLQQSPPGPNNRRRDASAGC